MHGAFVMYVSLSRVVLSLSQNVEFFGKCWCLINLLVTVKIRSRSFVFLIYFVKLVLF